MKDIIDLVLEKVLTSIKSGIFQAVEDTIVELKDLSTGPNWVSLNETICAFLNTNGGYVICGIREKSDAYKITGFDRNNESKLIDLTTKYFQNDKLLFLDLSLSISFEYRDVEEKTIAIISVLPLSQDQKYISFKGECYERVLNQDKKISEARLKEQKEYKFELENSKELQLVKDTTKKDLDVEKINQFILRINTTGKKETIKKDIEDASDFLLRRYCIDKEGQVTTLGMLLFGEEPFRFLENRAEVDCFFETGNEIGRDKKFLQDDVLNLTNDTFSFVWNHIKVGRTYVGGGQSLPEFPEKLIREVINNALVHRDYTINRFITVKINPGESIEIENPGSFKEKMLIKVTHEDRHIQRIIPGMPDTKNPKLANVFKIFDKIESQGIGMATLVSVCLDDLIDVPYYDLSKADTISLVIPSGQLIDEPSRFWLNSYAAFFKKRLQKKPSLEHERVLVYLLKSELLNQKLRRYYTLLMSPSNNHFEVLDGLIQSGLVVEVEKEPNAKSKTVYLLEKVLLQIDFKLEIEAITRQSLDFYSQEALLLLNIIYRFNVFNEQGVKPNVLTPEVYNKLYGKQINPTQYESLGRKVRKICKDLDEKAGILEKASDGRYSIKNIVNSVSNLDKNE